MRSEIIYVSGPYTAPTPEGEFENVCRAIEAGVQVMEKGHYPLIPHMAYMFDKCALEMGIKYNWKIYLDWDIRLLERCDSILYLAPSTGADVELEVAKSQKLKVYHSIDEIIPVQKEYHEHLLQYMKIMKLE